MSVDTGSGEEDKGTGCRNRLASAANTAPPCDFMRPVVDDLKNGRPQSIALFRFEGGDGADSFVRSIASIRSVSAMGVVKKELSTESDDTLNKV